MSVSLLNIGAHLSLEFEPADLDAVRSFIWAHYPDASSEEAGIATVVRFGGEDFTFQSEWDDPCLIAHSVKGNELLRSIHTHFSEDERPQLGR